jgi:hypothetical protein
MAMMCSPYEMKSIDSLLMVDLPFFNIGNNLEKFNFFTGVILSVAGAVTSGGI